MRISALAVLSALFALNLQGDILELKTGERIEGRFRQATAVSALLEVAGQQITIPLTKVQAIYFGAGTGPTTGSTALREALEALQALRSVTTSGITVRDYAPRVLDARVKLDRYRQDSAARPAMEVAMHEYELASEVWSASIAPLEAGVGVMLPIGNALERNPDISKCPAVRSIIEQVDETKGRVEIPGISLNDQHTGAIAKLPWIVQRSVMIGHWVSHKPGVLWTCASAQVGEAERLAMGQ